MTRSILLALICCTAAQADTIPQQVARKALNGDYGTLQEWQRVGYSRLLNRGATEKTAWVTCYWTGEPGVNTETASGRRVEQGRTAAMLEPRWGMPWGTFVLVTTPEGMTLRQVWDTGSRANARRAQAKKAQTWIDLFVPGPRSFDYVSDIYVCNWR